ncbi:S1 family peptidase [Xanthobacter oligotrophicus]|uniref:S1 family peptidase n=1 Tax=Xanthobacter oligotrophicus TaxID=2607286 RepID=UPI0011F2340D|nr:trypsin-like serine protease [Xanthobacter oligotrophicus]MCG5235984.1 trypsin-like serine protease [Xanthobacter oligotrophicus]
MIAARLPAFALVAALLAPGAAQAIVGGAPAAAEVAAQTVLIVSTRGASCTGAVLAPDLVLTAAHCVAPAADYAVAIIGDGPPKLVPAKRIAVHPRFDAGQFQTRRPTPDLALVKLAEPLPGRFRTARLANADGLPEKGTAFLLAGYGVIADGQAKSAGTLRTVALPSIGTTGGIMVRLSAPEGAAGACTGDSGGPAFRDGAVAGVTGWATGPGGSRGCGGVTGVTLVSLHRDWIEATAKSLGSPLGSGR